MARFINKMPNLKFPKYKMKGIEDIEELNVEYTPELVEKLKNKSQKLRGENYEGTNYQTVKEFFERSTTIYKDRTFILEKFNRKGFVASLLTKALDAVHLGWLNRWLGSGFIICKKISMKQTLIMLL